MAEVASVFASVMPSAKGFGRSLEGQVGGEMGSTGKRLGGKLGTALKVGAAAAIGGAAVVAGFLKGSLDEAREAQKVGALTNSVIKATGGAANVTAKQVGDLAGALSRKTGIDDEVIQSGQNMLLTFKNIRNETGKGNDIFNQTSKTLVDMSAAMGTEPKQAAIQLGKALNDPIKGVAALGRVGVTFTDQQKDQIKTLVESGRTMQAQKIVLKELNSEFGGAAAAQATAGDKAKVAWGNLQEAVGTAILPLWDKILQGGTKVMLFVTDNIGPAFAAIGRFIEPAKAAIAGLFASFSGGGGGGGLLSSLTGIGQSLAANFLPVLRSVGTYAGTLLAALGRLGGFLAANLMPVFTAVAGVISAQVVPIVASLARFFYGTLLPSIIRIVSAVAGSLAPVFTALAGTFRSQILPVISMLLAKFREYQPTIQKVIGVIVTVIGAVLRFAAAVLGRVLPPLIRFVGFLAGNLIRVIVKVIGWQFKLIGIFARVGATVVRAVVPFVRFGAKVLGIIGKVLGTVARFYSGVARFMGRVAGVVIGAVKAWARWQAGIAQKVGAALRFVGSIPGKIKKALGNVGSLLYNSGKALMEGLARGIGAAIGNAIEKVRAGVARIKGLLPGSPVKWGPLTSWNNGGAGKRLVGLLAEGLKDTRPVDNAMSRLAGRIAIASPPRLALDAYAASSAGLGASDGRVYLVLEDGQAFPAYVDRRSDNRINAAAAMSKKRHR